MLPQSHCSAFRSSLFLLLVICQCSQSHVACLSFTGSFVHSSSLHGCVNIRRAVSSSVILCCLLNALFEEINSTSVSWLNKYAFYRFLTLTCSLWVLIFMIFKINVCVYHFVTEMSESVSNTLLNNNQGHHTVWGTQVETTGVGSSGCISSEYLQESRYGNQTTGSLIRPWCRNPHTRNPGQSVWSSVLSTSLSDSLPTFVTQALEAKVT